ncbi:hypothetical protein NFI96_018469 [Prochilodus magdalenae]|nr:hypothetical protein NFI96_018469 [Prochilodus magdalenae]
MLDYRIVCIIAILTIFHSTFSEQRVDPLCESLKKDGDLVIQRATTNDRIATICCPNLKDDEDDVCITLCKNTSKLHSTDFNRTHALNSSDPKHRFHVSVENNTVRYLISIPQVNDTSVYQCKIHDRTALTFLLVKDIQPFCPYEGMSLSWLLLTVACGLFALYNLIITILACSFGWKLKNEEENQNFGQYHRSYTMIAILVTVILGIPLGNALIVSQPYYVVGSQGQASLHCTFDIKRHPEEMKVSLYKGMYGENRICTASVNTSEPHIMTDGGVHCKGNVSKGRVDLTIFGLKGEDTDLYRCQVEIIFPPPYLSRIGNGTLVYIPETPDCPTEHTQARIQDNPEITPMQNPSLPLILICAVLITTTIILILQVMSMMLAPSRSSPQIIPQKGDYKNFW